MSATAPKPTDADGIIREHIEHHPDLRPLGVCLHGPGPQPCPLCRASAPIHPTPASAPPATAPTPTMLSFTDPIAARWPDDSATGVLEDLLWGIRKGGPYHCDALMVEKLSLILAALRHPTVTVYDTTKLAQMTATVSAPPSPLTVKGSGNAR